MKVLQNTLQAGLPPLGVVATMILEPYSHLQVQGGGVAIEWTAL